MGLVYFQKGDYAKSIESYEKTLDISPSYVDVYYDLASVYEASGRPAKAIEAYKKAASLTPDPWQAHLSMGQLYLKMGRRQEAISEFEFIIESNPRSQAAKEANKLLESLR
jgi:tetratricopeptide (TPR) repeat protein